MQLAQLFGIVDRFVLSLDPPGIGKVGKLPIPQEIVDASNGKFEIKIVCREKEAGPVFRMGILKQP